MENEKYQTQLDSLRDSKLDGQIKQKKEIDHLRNELRKARIRLEHKRGFTMVIWPEFRTWQYRVNDHPYAHPILLALTNKQ